MLDPALQSSQKIDDINQLKASNSDQNNSNINNSPSTTTSAAAAAQNAHEFESGPKRPKLVSQSVSAHTTHVNVSKAIKISSTSIDNINIDVLKLQNKKLSETVQHYQILLDRTTNQKESLDIENERLKLKIISLEESLFSLNSTVKNLDTFFTEKFDPESKNPINKKINTSHIKDSDGDTNENSCQVPIEDQYDSFVSSNSTNHTANVTELQKDYKSISETLKTMIITLLFKLSGKSKNEHLDIINESVQQISKPETNLVNEQTNAEKTSESQLSYFKEKNESLKKVIKQLEGDVSSKEQRIIKFENIISENEVTIDKLHMEVEQAKHQSQISLKPKEDNDTLNMNNDNFDGLTKDDVFSQLKADLKAKSDLVEKYQSDLANMESQNHLLQKTITQLEDSKEFANIDELRSNHIYKNIQDQMTIFIHEKRSMEEFLLSAVKNSGEATSEISTFAKSISEEYIDVHKTLVEKNMKLEEANEIASEELMIITQDYNNMLIATDQLKHQNSQLVDLMQKIVIQKKQLQSENYRMQYEISQLSKDPITQQKELEGDSCNGLTDFDAKSFTNYLDSLLELRCLKNCQAKELSKSQKDSYYELALNFKQAIDKMKLYLRINAVQSVHLKNLKLLENSKIVELRKKEEMLLKELEVTGSALEDLQEQSTALLDKLKQKDEANFKIITDFQQLENVAKTKSDQCTELSQQNESLKIELKLQLDVLKKIEEQNEQFNTHVLSLENHVKKMAAEEIALNETIQNNQLNISELSGEIKSLNLSSELQRTNQLQLENTIIEERTIKRRLIAQIRSLQSQLSSALGKPGVPGSAASSSNEPFGSAEDIPLLLEEIKEYKSKLTCPCCNFRRKNAILSKCSHVFCLECLTIRFETRQRKCPKCNASFGPNDFKKIYLE